MNHRKEYEIAFVGLKPGIHKFSFEVTDKFFDEFQQQDFKNCKANIKLTLDKKNGFLLLKFELDGVLEVICDRCNGNLPMQLWDEYNVMVKMVDEPEMMNEQEEDPDVYYISRGESHLNIENWIYEFINLSIPMHKTCNYENMDGPYCNKEAREMLKKMETDSDKKENPLWKGLEKFKDLEN